MAAAAPQAALRPVHANPLVDARAASVALSDRLEAARGHARRAWRPTDDRPSTHAVAHRIDGEVVTLIADAGEFDGDWRDPTVVQRALFVVVEGLRRARPDLDPHFVVALSTFTVEAPTALYLPLANDVRGIGYRHLEPAEVFRFTPGRLDGVLFMNTVRRVDDPQTATLFLQELGHRWGVYVRLPDPDGTRLLGRDCAHWNHFARAAGPAMGGSAMEGNPWVELGGGRFAAEVPPTVGYDPAQLYLMGALPAAAVPPITLVSDVGRPCFDGLGGGAINPRHAPPTWRTGERAEIESDGVETVPWQAVVAHEGPRRPSHGEARTRWSAVFVLLAGPADDPQPAIERVDRARLSWGARFTEATESALSLDTTLAAAAFVAEPGSAGFGERCLDPLDCAPDWPRCVPTATGDRICTARCAAHGDCGVGACCVATADGAWCAPALDPCPTVDPGPDGGLDAGPSDMGGPPPPDGGPTGGAWIDGRPNDAGPGQTPRGCAQRPGRSSPRPSAVGIVLGLGLLFNARRRTARV